MKLSMIKNSCGFSLIEVIVVIVVLGILASVAVQSLPTSLENRRQLETEREMEVLAFAITGNPSLAQNGARTNFGYIGDIGAFPPNLQALYQNTPGYSTWNGPYLPPGFVQDSVDFKIDEWSQPYAYSGGIAIISNGSGSALTKKIADAASDYLYNTLNGSILDANDSVPGNVYLDSVSVVFSIPNGSGGTSDRSTNPDSAGDFTLDSLPVGTHPLKVIYIPNNDTLLNYVTILPRHKSSREFRFVSGYFGGSGSSPGADSVIYEEFTEAKRTSNGNSLTIPTPSGTSENDLLIVVVVTDANKSSQLSPPGGEGWTEIDRSQQQGAVTLGVWWKLADAAESPNHQFNWGGNSQEAYGWMMRFTGHDPVSPINASEVDGGSSNSPTCPSATATVDNTLVLRIGGFDDDDITIDSPGLGGHTTITMDESSSGGGTCSGGAGYQYLASAGSTGTATFSLTNSEQWRTMTIAIAPNP